MLRSTIVALLTLTLTPACDDRRDEHDDETGSASESEGEEAGESASETGAPVEETEGEAESETEADDATGEVPGGGEDSITPIVLAFSGEAVHFNTAVTASFDLTGTMSVVTDWPTSTTPWLALDRNGNGKIDDGGELFGSATVLATGETAANGFVALRELDSNVDGRVDAADEQWGRILVWSDVNSDRVSTVNELRTASQRELVAIELGYTVEHRCDIRGNCEVERAGFIYRDGRGRELRGAAIDVHLRLR
jgi:hypothetical protein